MKPHQRLVTTIKRQCLKFSDHIIRNDMEKQIIREKAKCDKNRGRTIIARLIDYNPTADKFYIRNALVGRNIIRKEIFFKLRPVKIKKKNYSYLISICDI